MKDRKLNFFGKVFGQETIEGQNCQLDQFANNLSANSKKI